MRSAAPPLALALALAAPGVYAQTQGPSPAGEHRLDGVTFQGGERQEGSTLSWTSLVAGGAPGPLMDVDEDGALDTGSDWISSNINTYSGYTIVVGSQIYPVFRFAVLGGANYFVYHDVAAPGAAPVPAAGTSEPFLREGFAYPLDIPPPVGVRSRHGDIAEGGTHVFTVFTIGETMPIHASDDVVVGLGFVNQGNVIAGAVPTGITVPGGSTFAHLTVATRERPGVQANGFISVTIQRDSAPRHRYRVDRTQASVTAQVLDNDVTVSLEVTEHATEGDTWTAGQPRPGLFLVATPTPLSDLTVSQIRQQWADPAFNVADAVLHDDSNETFRTDIVIPAGQARTQVITLAADVLLLEGMSNSVDNAAKWFRLWMRNGASYINGSPGSAAVASSSTYGTGGVLQRVLDPADAVMNLTAAATSVAEGGDVVFTLASAKSHWPDFTVQVTLAQTGDFAAETLGATMVTLTGSHTSTPSATITVPTTDDERVESDGVITATAAAGTGYSLSASAVTVTVTSDDVQGLRITADTETRCGGADPCILESEDAVFTARRNAAEAAGVTVTVDITDTGAFTTAGARMVTIAANQTEAKLTVDIDDDGDAEANGTVTATLATPPPTGYVNQGGAASVVVVDNDGPRVGLAVKDSLASFTEGSATQITFVLSITNATQFTAASNAARAVDYFVEQEGGDWVSIGLKNVTFPRNMNSHEFPLTITDNMMGGESGYIRVTLSPVLESRFHADPGMTAVSIAIVDDDAATAILRASMSSITEGESVSFTAEIDAPQQSSVALPMTLAETGDFLSDKTAEFILTIPPGMTTANTGLVATRDDNIDEPDGRLIATLGDLPGTLLGGGASVTVTVMDNDEGLPVRLSADPALPTSGGVPQAVEGAEVVMIASLDAPRGGDFTVPVAIDEAGNFVAFETRQAREVVIPQGATEARFTIATIGDNTDELNGSLTVSIDAAGLPPGYVAAGDAATVELLDDDGAPVISVAAAGGAEGGEAVFTVELRPLEGPIDGNVSDSVITVDYRAGAEGGDTARAGVDFTPVLGSLTFTPSDTEAGNTRQVAVALPNMDENDIEETFSFVLSNPVTEEARLGVTFPGGEVAPLRAQGTVQELPGLSIAADAETATEKEAAVFTISLSRALGEEVIVPVSVEQVGNVLAGAPPTSVAIAPGAVAAKLTVAVEDDARDEADATITVTISLPAGREEEFAFFGARSAATLVTDDDAPPTVSAHAPLRHATEGTRPLVFPVRLSAASERVITVLYTTDTESEAATATPDVDYRRVTGVLEFAPGDLERTVAVFTIADEISDPDEIVVLTISVPDPAVVTLGAATAQGVIREGLDEDSARALNEAILPYVAAAIGDQTARAVRDRIRDAFGGNDASVRRVISGRLEEAKSLSPYHSRESGNPDKESSGAAAMHPGDGLAAAPPAVVHPTDGALYPVWTEDAVAWSDADLGRWNPLNRDINDLAFTMALNERGGEGDANTREGLTLWGRGYYSDIYPNEGPISFKGDITGGMIGIDALHSDLLFGMSVNHSRAEIYWNNQDFTGDHETEVTGLHPYLGWQWREDIHFWSALGYARGETKIREHERPGEFCEGCDFNVELKTAAIGTRNRLREAAAGGGAVEVAFIGDTAYTHLAQTSADTVSVETGWARAGLELDYDRPLAGGGAFGGTLEITWRHDYGDARSGSGAEVGAGLDLASPALGLRFDLHARTLLAHADGGNEWGVHGSLIWATPTDRPALSLSFRPEWGVTGEARERLWDGGLATTTRHSRESGNPVQTVGGLAAMPRYGGNGAGVTGMSAEHKTLRYNLEVNYGIPLFRGADLLTIFARSDLQNAGNDLGVGADFKLGEYFTTGYEAATRYGTDHRAYLRYQVGF